MKIVTPKAQLLTCDSNELKLIEQIGRICYKSEDKITKDSYKQFIKMLVGRHHLAMLEHGTVYLRFYDHGESICNYEIQMTLIRNVLFSQNKQIYVNMTYPYVTGSYRAFYELLETMLDVVESDDQKQCDIESISFLIKDFFDPLMNESPEVFEPLQSRVEKICDTYDKDVYSIHKENIAYMTTSRSDFIHYVKHHKPSEKRDEILRQHIRHSVKFVCDRGVSHELVRHRPASFAQESTRYCNYANDKFNTEITVVDPCFWEYKKDCYDMWKKSCEVAEETYFALLNSGAIPQEARDVLPTSLKTEITVTATENEWQHILDLRYHGTTGAPHPQMVQIMQMAYLLLTKASESRLV